MSTEVHIVKLDAQGNEKLRYPARLISSDAVWGYACVEAWFALDRVSVDLFEIEAGDRMIEHFWTTRYFNVFEVHTPRNSSVRGFYCNITRPAHMSHDIIAAEDLALDFVADTVGNTVVLDKDEFDALDLSQSERTRALAALEELQSMYAHRVGPFSLLREYGQTRTAAASIRRGGGSPPRKR